MFYFKSSKGTPLEKLLNLDPRESEAVKNEIKELIINKSLTCFVNSFLQDISRNEPITSLSTEAFSSESTIMEWRLARSNVGAATIRIVTGSLHANRNVFFLYPNDLVIYFHGSGECKAILYEFEEVNCYDEFDKSRKIKSRMNVNIKNGDYVKIKAGINGFQIININDLIMFEVSSFKHHNIVWNFNTNTGEMLYPSSADVSSTRMSMAMDVLKSIGDERSVEIISALAKNHHQHFIRWKAIESISFFNDDLTIELLKNAKNDPHPEIRNAANKTLLENGVI